MALSMEPNNNGSNPMDPRGLVGQLSRGTNTYMGASKSPYAGQVTTNAVEGMNSASLLPQYRKPSLQEIARSFINGNQQ